MEVEMVREYLFYRFTPKKEPLPFPEYLLPRNRYKNDFWITQEGICITPRDMDDRHLINTVRKIHRRHPNLANLYMEINADKYIMYGIPKSFQNKKGNVQNKLKYKRMWDELRIYMLLRRELKIRELEEYINEYGY